MVWNQILSISTKPLPISMMLGVGMTRRDVSDPLKNYQFTLIAVLMNIVLIPLRGFGLAILLGITGALAIEFVLITIVPGAAFAPKPLSQQNPMSSFRLP